MVKQDNVIINLFYFLMTLFCRPGLASDVRCASELLCLEPPRKQSQHSLTSDIRDVCAWNRYQTHLHHQYVVHSYKLRLSWLLMKGGTEMVASM